MKVTPKILIAPGFTSEVTKTGQKIDGAPVTTELEGIADRLSGVPVIVADGPNTNDADAISIPGDWSGSRRVFVVDPWVKVLDPVQQARWSHEAPLPAWPASSPNPTTSAASGGHPPIGRSRGIVGTSRPVEFALDDPNARANHLNENEVATIIQQDGYRLWGNRTCSSDPKWAFLSVVRINDQINESVLRSHLWAVDRNITKTYLEDVVDGVNAYLRELEGLGAILGGRCWIDPELNSPRRPSKKGRVYFDYEFTPTYPAERLTFRSRLVE